MDLETEQRISETVNAILKDADLKATTERSIRKQASAALGMKLSAPEYKCFVRGLVDSFLIDLHVNAAAISKPSGEAQTTATQVVDDEEDEETEVDVHDMESAAAADDNDDRGDLIIDKMMASEEPMQIINEADEDARDESDVDDAPQIEFNDYGNIIGHKDKLSKRSLALLKTSISVTYGNWGDVPVDLVDDVWETLQKEFNIPDSLKKSMCKTFADQLKSWRKRLRMKYFDRYNSAQISSLIDKNPKSIQRDAWNVFIERESSNAKLLEREQAALNRAHKTDVHVSGRRSYAQISQLLTRMGIKHTRVDLYAYCRRRPDGTYHTATAAMMESIKQIQSKQGESSVSIDKDALTQLFGQDVRGGTRGIGSRVSRTHALVVEQVHAIQEMKKRKKQAKKTKKSGKMENIKKRLDNIEARISSFSSKQSSVDTNQPSALPSHSPPPHVSSPQVSSPRKYKIRSTLDYGRFIGQGRGSSQPTPGVIVHQRPMLHVERKISVDLVYEGMQSEQLYLGSQGCCTTFGEVQGGFVVWLEYLLEEIKD